MTMFIILEPVPGSDHSRHRGKDVAITLHGHAINAWRDGGSQWKALNSRLISASMDVGDGRTIHVLSCHDPTYCASRGLKEDFYNSLKEAIPSILSADCFISC